MKLDGTAPLERCTNCKGLARDAFDAQFNYCAACNFGGSIRVYGPATITIHNLGKTQAEKEREKQRQARNRLRNLRKALPREASSGNNPGP